MRTRLTSALTMRSVPYLKFHLDESAKKEIAVLELLRKAAMELEESDRARAQAQGDGPATTQDGIVK